MAKRKKRAPKTKGPTRAQLIARVRQLEEKLERLRVGDTLRRDGEHWYQLVEMFDADLIRRIPYRGANAYMMGMLKDLIVVEMPEGTTHEQMLHFTRHLKRAGITHDPLYITKGVRFLKLGAVPEEMEKQLDAAGFVKEDDDDGDEDAEDAGAERADDPGARPEPSGDGLGDPLAADVGCPGDGGGGDEERERAEEDGAPPDEGGG